jgi:putative protein kinase ArgK-like GTPase of G3E family
MDTPMLTIAEAVEKTGRSASTIRRIIRTITDAPSHEDRDGIVPNAKEAAAFKKKGENFTWKIREDILMKHSASAPKDAKKPNMERTEIVQMLQKELTLKNQQIEKQLDVIQSLNERLREGNILMGSLQKHLALPQGDQPQSEGSPVMASATSSAPKADTAAKPAKKGILRWMFR